jgi:CubicO group peptidase (beta-lactamase class C family)
LRYTADRFIRSIQQTRSETVNGQCSTWLCGCVCPCAMVLAAVAVAANAQTAKPPDKTGAEKTAAERAEAIRLVDAWLDSVQAYQHIPAISAGVVAGDNLIWAKGYGTIDEQHNVPASPKTIYSICSISKLFTAVALMQQYEAGNVHLDEPITPTCRGLS